MKKILLLFSVAGLLSLSSCNNDDNFDNDTIAEVFETPALSFTSGGNFENVVALDPQIYNSDMILVYRLTDDPATNLDVWELIPRTVYFENGAEIDYDYNFTQEDVLLRMRTNDDLTDPIYNAYTQNQIFRIVIVPGYGSNFRTSSNAMEQFKDYNAVVKKYGINDSKVKQLSVK